MIIAGYEFADEKPFEHVYLTGLVRDKKRRKMSKSLGNSLSCCFMQTGGDNKMTQTQYCNL